MAREYGHGEVTPAHLFLSLLVPEVGLPCRALRSLGCNIHETRALVEAELEGLQAAPRSVHEPRSSPALREALQVADVERQVFEEREVTDTHALVAILSPDGGLPPTLRKALAVKRQPLLEAIRSLAQAESLASGETPAAGPAATLKGTFRYCTDLTAEARAGRIDPVVGREREISLLTAILSRRRKRNAVIVGEPGVGKTAVVEGLALAIVSGDVPDSLRGRRILSLDLPAMVAGAKYKGEFEERFKALLGEIESHSDSVVLFIDELHGLLAAGAGGGGVDAANILKPALTRGDVRVIGATTVREYRQKVEKDEAFARRFERLDVGEPDEAACLAILRGLRPRYEAHHKVAISDAALTAAVRLSRRYVAGRFLPDKAVDLLDEAAAGVRLLGEKVRQVFGGAETPPKEALLDSLERALVDHGYELPAADPELGRVDVLRAATRGLGAEVGEAEVARRVSLATGIPIHRMLSSERERLTRLEDHLHRRIVGQEGAVREVSQAIRRARAGVKRPDEPVGTFLFVGPTGTGKTELAKALAEFLFDDEKAMVRIDMSEYTQEISVNRLIGAPPAYAGYGEGGALTNAVLRRPYSVVLFDEIEKAHFRCFDLLLQVMDDGRLTDSEGRTADFTNAVLILTSNFAGPWIVERIQSGGGVTPDEIRQLMLSEGRFRPEFLNRITSFVVFDPLSQEQVARIVDLQMKTLEGLLAESQVRLRLSPEARSLLSEQGYDPSMGARPVKRLIDQLIANPLAMELVRREPATSARTADVEVVQGEIKVSLKDD